MVWALRFTKSRKGTSVTRNKYNVITHVHVAIHCTRSPSGLLIVPIIAKHQEVLFKGMKGERAR